MTANPSCIERMTWLQMRRSVVLSSPKYPITHTAGTMAAITNNARGVAGTAGGDAGGTTGGVGNESSSKRGITAGGLPPIVPSMRAGAKSC